jgi:glycosyltransferase involved in cell wall biosynthesis
MKTKISVVTSLYKSELYVLDLYNKLLEVFNTLSCDYEIIFVDDYYPDKAKEKALSLAKIDKNLKVIALSKNFGQHPALTAGLTHASGDYIVVMDSDLQDDPNEIINLYNQIEKGYDIVWAKRSQRQDSFLKKLSSNVFYKFLSYLTDTKWDSTIANFGIFKKKTINTFLTLKEQNRTFPMMMMWLGYKSTSINVEHQERAHDSSSYTLRKLVSLALNIIIYYSQKPLKLMVSLGFFIALLGFLFVIKIAFNCLFLNNPIPGWSSLIASIWLLSGITISIIGFCGLYIGNIFNEVKNRPFYIIDEIENG